MNGEHYNEWLALRKHENFARYMLNQPGSWLAQLMAKGLVDPTTLKLTPAGVAALANDERTQR